MTIEEERRLHRCCFTGHRPEKLQQGERTICKALEKEIRRAIADGFTVFISGMARGVDIWAAEIVLKYRHKNEDIKLVCALPYKGFEETWSTTWKRRYDRILKRADLIRFICPHYYKGVFQIRNEWMVNHSARIIAVFNGESGGTKNAIRYAQRSGVEVYIQEG